MQFCDPAYEVGKHLRNILKFVNQNYFNCRPMNATVIETKGNNAFAI